MTDAERLNDIERKLRCWGYLSHYPDAEHDVAWLLDKLAECDARIAELEARPERNKWGSRCHERPSATVRRTTLPGRSRDSPPAP